MLDALRNDREKSRRMLPNGSYIREEGGEGTSSQEALYRYFSSIHVSPDGEEQEEKSEEKAEPAEVTLPRAEEKQSVLYHRRVLRNAEET